MALRWELADGERESWEEAERHVEEPYRGVRFCFGLDGHE